MELHRFSRRLVALFPALGRGIARHEHNDLSRGKITLPQVWTLDYLAHHDQAPMNTLAQALGISKPAATGLVDRLIAHGLAARTGDPQDRRVVRVAITPKGRRQLTNIWEQKRRVLATVFGKISARDRTHYLATLERVVSILEQS